MHVLSWPAAGQILKNPAIQVYKTNEINYIQEARNRSVQARGECQVDIRAFLEKLE
jgi:hypothetical protein